MQIIAVPQLQSRQRLLINETNIQAERLVPMHDVQAPLDSLSDNQSPSTSDVAQRAVIAANDDR